MSRCLLVVGLGAARVAAQGAPVWPELTLTAATWDAGRGRTVVVGTSARGFETWEWDGRVWERLSMTGPSPGEEPVVVHDEARGRVVLFDGRARSAGSNATSTWLWDGASWTLADSAGPTPRLACGLAWDPQTQRVLLFGGSAIDGSGELNDLWAWDGGQWTRVHESGAQGAPPPRALFGLAYDAVRGRLVVAAGFRMVEGQPQIHDDTWEWDGHAWTQSAARELPGRDHVSMAYDPDRREIVLHGGGTPATGPLGDTWSYDGRRWRRIASNGPPGARHRVFFDGGARAIMTYGGWRSSRARTNQMHALRDTTWVEVIAADGSRGR